MLLVMLLLLLLQLLLLLLLGAGAILRLRCRRQLVLLACGLWRALLLIGISGLRRVVCEER